MARSTGLIRILIGVGLLIGTLLYGVYHISSDISADNAALMNALQEDSHPLPPSQAETTADTSLQKSASAPQLNHSSRLGALEVAAGEGEDWILATTGTSKVLSDWFPNSLDQEDRDLLGPLFSVPIHNTSAVWPGYTVFAFSFNSYLLMYDITGKIVGARRTGTRREHIVYHGVKFVNSSTILALRVTLAQPHNHNIVKTTHFMLWNVKTGAELLVKDPLPPHKYATFHHDLDYNPVTRTFLGLYKYLHRNASGIDDKAVYDAFYEVTEDGRILWEWDAKKEFPWDQHQRENWIYTGDCAQVWSLQKKDCIDWMHGNTLYWDFEDDVLYYNSRSLDTFFKIDRRTRRRLWGVGRMGTMKMVDKDGKPTPSLFYHAHSVDKQDDQTFMLFDNNYNNRHAFHGGPRLANLHFQSGMAEVQISPSADEARVSWSWYAPRNYSSVYNGDADSLPNGNVLGTFTQGISIVEVNKAGKVVWELRGPPDKAAPYRWPIYRAERVYERPPLLHPRQVKVMSTAIAVHLQLLVWNTHKSRLHCPARVVVQHNQSQFRFEQTFLLHKYWKATQVNITIPLANLHPFKCASAVSSKFHVTVTNVDGIDVQASIPIVCL